MTLSYYIFTLYSAIFPPFLNTLDLLPHLKTTLDDITHLVQLLELHELCEDVLQGVLGVPGSGRQLGRHSQDVATLPHVVLQVLILALIGYLHQTTQH